MAYRAHDRSGPVGDARGSGLRSAAVLEMRSAMMPSLGHGPLESITGLMAIASINPTTGETLRSFVPISSAELESKLALAAAAFRSWRHTSFADRSGHTRLFADLL